MRAGLRKNGKALDSLILANGLNSYSERGQEYVDSLRSLVRGNGFNSADAAMPRVEPLAFAMGAEDDQAVQIIAKSFETKKKSGEFEKIVEQMRLE